MTVSSQTQNLEAGSFCWADVAATDPTSTHKFFSELFGWKRKVRPTEDAQAYSIMTLDGCNVAGICGVEVDAPSQWMSYLLVDDLTQATERAVALGANTLRARADPTTRAGGGVTYPFFLPTSVQYLIFLRFSGNLSSTR